MTTRATKQKLKFKFEILRRQAEKRGLNKHDIVRAFLYLSKFPTVKDEICINKQDAGAAKRSRQRNNLILVAFFGVLLASLCYIIWSSTKITKPRCFLEYDDYTREMTRPLLNCDFCRNLQRVPVETNISQSRFQEQYAYNFVPVIIRGETSNWTALKTFNFRFIGELYNSTEGAFDHVMTYCMFHAYQTNFTSLESVFAMPERRANFTDGQVPWYIGWSNCHSGAREKLRKHYQRPSFLPPTSDVSILDWFFMGVPGHGALMHVDYIQKPSWQVQISGRKTWTLAPPVECEKQCQTLNVTVEKGDILVVETNIWFHATYVHPGELSIAVGSEYD